MDRRILHTDSGNARRYAQHVHDTALIHGQRTGQKLFNMLNPPELADQVRHKSFDPSRWGDMTVDEIEDWVKNHLVFDDHGHIIALFDGFETLWERERP
jgi:hypothetical protein